LIDILLATYRPKEVLLRAQLDSIRAQKDVAVNVICREDVDGEGPRANFSHLLAQSKAAYTAFSDQDDIWLPTKLSRSMARMQKLERRYGRETPLLVFTDGYVTDANLVRLSGTVLSRQRVDVAGGVVVNRLLMQNFIAGNAMLFNAALRELAGEVPQDALMHDAWVALVAAAFGHISLVDEPLYDYRQHEGNVLGASTAGWRHAWSQASEGVAAFRNRLALNVRQARAFARRFGDRTPAAVLALSGLTERNWLSRRRAIVDHRLYKQGWFRNLALLAFA